MIESFAYEMIEPLNASFFEAHRTFQYKELYLVSLKNTTRSKEDRWMGLIQL